MSEVARLVGMEQRSYEKDGKQREYCGTTLDSLKKRLKKKQESNNQLLPSMKMAGWSQI